jgi:signal transduction histidine kinase
MSMRIIPEAVVRVVARGYRDDVATMKIPRTSRRRNQLLDVALAALLLISMLGSLLVRSERGSLPLAIALPLGVLAIVPLVWRRSAPLLVLGITGLAAFTLMVTKGSPGEAAFGPLVALYTVATRSERRISLVAGIVTLVGVMAGVLISRPHRLPWEAFAFPVVVISAAWLIGDNLRVRRAYVAELEAKATRADTERAAEMQRAASEERSRIARELHDVVAHHVSVIAVQAGAARMLSEKEGNQPGAHQALAAVEASAREALGELRRLLGVLRHDGGEAPDLSPQPGLRQLPKLVNDVRLAGLPVELNVIGEPVPLPPALDLSAFRIVQEALTNVLKHEGPVPTSVIVRYLPADLEIDVIDSAPRRPNAEGASSGRGLIGMQERVAMFGGELRAGPGASGGFEVRASMPLTQDGT